METVGFIGLGNMGSGMAGNIQKADYPLVVYDLRPEITKRFADQGARPANSPAEVARLSDVTLTSLPGPTEVEAVATAPRVCWKASSRVASTLICPPVDRR